MLTHSNIWMAIDALAAEHGLSPSALARRAGLDPTTFNRSKRTTSDGRLRWPSTESLAKVLQATGTPFSWLLSFTRSEEDYHVPVVGFAEVSAGGYFSEGGIPAKMNWRQVAFPAMADAHAYALEISGESMLPLYRDGDVVIVSPAAEVRPGDRVVVMTTSGEVLAKELQRRTAEAITLRSVNPAFEDRVLPLSDVAWVARILWASQ